MQQYRYTGPGKYIVGAFLEDGSRVRKAVVGELVDLTEKQFARFADRFEHVDGAPVPTAEEVAAEAARVAAEAEATLMAELEAEAARVAAEAARVEEENAVVASSVATEKVFRALEETAPLPDFKNSEGI